MTNKVNYLLHTTFEPPYYQRQFENDLPKESATWGATANRALLLVIPYLSLDKRAGFAISTVMGGFRCFTSLTEAAEAFSHPEKGLFYFCGKIGQTALAVVALSTTLFNFQIGLIVTTSADLLIATVHLAERLADHQWKLSAEELAHILSYLLYLSIIMNGAIELIIASLVLQAIINLYQSWSEYQKDGRWPEAIAKFAMGWIRIYQASGQLEQMRRRDFFRSISKFTALLKQINKGRDVKHLIDSPLDKRDKEVILTDSAGNAFNFGVYFNGNGKGTVKGMNLQFRTHQGNGKEMVELDFKVNHLFRDRLEKVMDGMKGFNSGELKEFLRLTGSHADGIKIEQVPFKFSNEVDMEMGTACKITLEGLGSVTIGDTKLYPNLYDRVRVEVSKEQNLYQVHELLSFFNLDDALRTSSQEDVERLKMGQLFRVFHPKEATLFEREESFFTLSLEQLKSEMVKKAPEMEKTFQEYLPKMQAREIFPGRVRYSITGLSERLYQEGARSLVSTITGPRNEAFDRAASVIKMGMLAPEMRYSNGMAVNGLGPFVDFFSGGGDSVFTQLLTENNFRQQMDLGELYWGDVRMLFSLDLLETGTYQYHSDALGWRRLIEPSDPESVYDWNPYLDRPNIIDFVADEQVSSSYGHEVMVKERIPPSMIQGLIVPNETVKNNLLSHFRSKNIIGLNPEGHETILNIPIERFIHVGKQLSESWLT
ncbi:MAG TPA: hypothetical protein VLG76_01265 [Rhabdochlamydiaceae bacterium]|nr:hypothetical protein [Rhabdochlamydiaceae bacterium]